MDEGRPPMFNLPEDLQNKVDEYFTHVKEQSEPITITGLCIYLGFESRQSFYDYEKKPEFTYIIKKARLRVENGYEIKLSGNNVAGAIFVLKNMGWQDKTQQELSGGLDIGKKPSWFDDVEQKTA